MDFKEDEAVKQAMLFAARTTERILQTHPDFKNRETSLRTIAASLSIFSRIYVGSVHYEVAESDVALLFSIFGPIRSVQMIVDSGSTLHKGYGFVDFEVAEAAEVAVRADGMEIAHRPVKIGRPANFPSDLPPGVPRPPPNRVYVGGVAGAVGEDELARLLQIIGPVRACRLAPDMSRPGQHRGYGYVEFERVADAVSATILLNGFELAGRRLAVIRAIVGGPLIDGMESAKWQAHSTQSVIVLKNIVDKAEVANEQEKAELSSDVALECSKYGSIVDSQLIVVNDDNVNFYIHYEDEGGAAAALKALNGRWFGGRQLAVHLYDLDRYLMRDLC